MQALEILVVDQPCPMAGLICFGLHEPEAPRCCVIKGLQSRQGGMAAPLSALPMEASGSCKIQVLVCTILSLHAFLLDTWAAFFLFT